jgi:predicted Zn finger-like uncharacterized protein
MTPMVVQCSSCLTEFELDLNKVPVGGVRARCSVCSAVITVPPPPVAAPAQHAAPTPEVHVPATEHAAEKKQAPESEQVPREEQRAEAVASSEPVTASASFQSSWEAPVPAPASASASASASVAAYADEGLRRPINPFLTRDPALRAKRLARALVSDIVAYHPARHAEGLRDGTLKTLFRDEIKKSYEEYVDQVGRDFAGSTTHFQDALNDVLASGKKLF